VVTERSAVPARPLVGQEAAGRSGNGAKSLQEMHCSMAIYHNFMD
jgi:hypothetical protein